MITKKNSALKRKENQFLRKSRVYSNRFAMKKLKGKYVYVPISNTNQICYCNHFRFFINTESFIFRFGQKLPISKKRQRKLWCHVIDMFSRLKRDHFKNRKKRQHIFTSLNKFEIKHYRMVAFIFYFVGILNSTRLLCCKHQIVLTFTFGQRQLNFLGQWFS